MLHTYHKDTDIIRPVRSCWIRNIFLRVNLLLRLIFWLERTFQNFPTVFGEKRVLRLSTIKAVSSEMLRFNNFLEFESIFLELEIACS